MSHRVLVVDDEASIRSSLKMILGHAGYRFQEASSGKEALEMIGEAEPDVIILDIKMPGMDGLEVLETLRERGTRVPVIVVSGHGDIDTAVRATKLGAWNFLEKPFGEERVLLEVRNAIEHRTLRDRVGAFEVEAEERFEMVGASPAMERLRAAIAKAAPSHATVLITGESGTGKELVARAVHAHSGRRDAPFIRVNCAAIPDDLIESELFGHERGSFTGATGKQIGKFLQADHGTIFLDEIGDMSQRAQAKVLRALETGEIEPVGAARVVTVDVRVIAATNKDLRTEIGAGRFREDLYFRLQVIPVHCPPLRERAEDIPLLVKHFAEGTGRRFSDEAVEALTRMEWKGNVRELQNTVERLIIMTAGSGEVIGLDDLAAGTGGGAAAEPAAAGRLDGWIRKNTTLKEYKETAEKEFLVAMLEKHGWNISRTAKAIDTPRSNLYKKLEQYGLAKESMGADDESQDT